MIHSTGDTPGKGYYSCRSCGKVIHLDTDEDALPACPRCGKADWHKLS